ncbi:MAG: hypothetical protein IPF99_34920 [Deltaproteobacteria bacterium]|nr:hypothetical protein [Deltaproteobacteria bacterium]
MSPKPPWTTADLTPEPVDPAGLRVHRGAHPAGRPLPRSRRRSARPATYHAEQTHQDQLLLEIVLFTKTDYVTKAQFDARAHGYARTLEMERNLLIDEVRDLQAIYESELQEPWALRPLARLAEGWQGLGEGLVAAWKADGHEQRRVREFWKEFVKDSPRVPPQAFVDVLDTLTAIQPDETYETIHGAGWALVKAREMTRSRAAIATHRDHVGQGRRDRRRRPRSPGRHRVRPPAPRAAPSPVQRPVQRSHVPPRCGRCRGGGAGAAARAAFGHHRRLILQEYTLVGRKRIPAFSSTSSAARSPGSPR